MHVGSFKFRLIVMLFSDPLRRIEQARGVLEVTNVTGSHRLPSRVLNDRRAYRVDTYYFESVTNVLFLLFLLQNSNSF